LVRSALDALPKLLGERLGDVLQTQGEDVTIQSPLCVQLLVTAAELRGAGSIMAAAPNRSTPPVDSLSDRLDAALRHAIAASEGAHLLGVEPARPPTDAPPQASEHPPEPPWFASPLDRLFAGWQRAGTVEAHLRLLTSSARATLRELVALGQDKLNPPSLSPIPDLAELAQAANDLVASMRKSYSHPVEPQLVWLLAAAELGTRFGLNPSHPLIVRALDNLLRQPEAGSSPRVATPESEAGSAPRVATPESPDAEELSAPGIRAVAPGGLAPVARRPLRAQRAPGEVHVESALPFLLLGPLSHIGYLDSVAAIFQAAGLTAHLPAFASALAYKVLPPPERGWRRSDGSRRAAAAFAGLEEPLPEAELNGLHRLLAAHLGLPSATLAQSLIAGHTPGTPVVLAPAGDGFLLAEATGVFPISWSGQLDELLPALRALSGETVYVPRAGAGPPLLRSLHDNGVRFVTDAAPTRGESWRSVRRGPARRWWTNDSTASESVLSRGAEDAAVVMDDVTAFWRNLADESPSLAPETGSVVDTSFSIAAGIGLATLAWTLWREREPTTPLLALARLGDLDARVRFGSETVRVLVPLGRRHRDLSACGLLGPVRDVPWLGGRVLELGGG
jgi:hypothetical protein